MNTVARALFLIFAVASVTGCGAFKNTLAQDLALERWQMCSGKAPDVTFKEVKPDGQIWFLYSSPTGLRTINECLREAAVTQRQRATTPGANVAVAQPPSGVAMSAQTTPAAGGAAVSVSSIGQTHAPVWKIGDEWAYRYDGSTGAGTYVWSVVRSETMDG